MAARVEPWERQKTESPQAFEAFALYRDLQKERSVREVARRLSKSGALINRWSSEKSWVARAAAFDREQDRLARRAAEKERADSARRLVRVGSAYLGKSVEGLQSLDTAKMSATDVARLGEAGAKLLRQGLGEPDKVEVSGPGGGPVAIAALGPQEMRDYLAHLVELSRERIASTLPEAEETDAVVQEGPEANTV